MRRVVVTGLGVIAPCGEDKDTFYKNLIDGVSFTSKVENFDVSLFNSKVAAQDLEFDPANFGMSGQDARRMDRYVQFAVAAAKGAVQDANLDFSKLNKYRNGIVLANAICGTRFMEEEFLLVTDWGKNPIDPRKGRPYLYDAAMFNTPCSEISAIYGLGGINCTISTGCTAGTDSVGFAYEMIKDGRQDLIFAGASEAPITPISFGAFDVINAISKRNDEPHKASRPFEKNRDGFVLSEASGILVLEDLEHAIKRGARIYCEIIGFGTTCNAFHMTDLPADGQAMVNCIKMAFDDAKIEKEKIDYINTHGSSTPQNDVFETNAYKSFFGDYAYKIPISSIKSMIGHPLAAANAVESVLCSMIYQHNVLPPTINLEEPDPLCDLNYIPNKAIEKKVDYILKTSSGFSGIHSALIFKRYDE
ncbi:MAG: beta-ketoacyl-[acyl-carrier-protein] synthase family protein [Candidatus Omnitrophota bacterium]|nr:beta-ketoacyl-[acyl-carrier-protein] synthase family protein [Candidatus Omnitrophota bacterium]